MEPGKPEIEETGFANEIGQFKIEEIPTDFDESAVNSLSQSLNQTNLFLLGEMHGVSENPNIIYTLIKKFNLRSIALEWDEVLRPQIDKFLETGEIPNAISSYDGRITAGHFALLKRLKGEGILDELILFNDNSATWDQRDAQMARNIISARKVPTLIATGNLHSRVTPISNPDYPNMTTPMGVNLKNALGDLSSGNIEYQSGDFYNLGIRHFETASDIDLKAKFFRNEQGVYVFSFPVAHAAVVPGAKI